MDVLPDYGDQRPLLHCGVLEFIVYCLSIVYCLYLAKSLLFTVYGLHSIFSFKPLFLFVSCWKSNFLVGVIPKGSIKRSLILSLNAGPQTPRMRLETLLILMFTVVKDIVYSKVQ